MSWSPYTFLGSFGLAAVFGAALYNDVELYFISPAIDGEKTLIITGFVTLIAYAIMVVVALRITRQRWSDKVEVPPENGLPKLPH
jgi:hypothetical protein